MELGERIEEAANIDSTDVALNDEAQEYLWITPDGALELNLNLYTRTSMERFLKKTG